MNQTYGRLVSRAAIAAAAMASALLIKIFCVVVYGIGEYSGGVGGLAGGYCRVIDEFVGRALFAATRR